MDKKTQGASRSAMAVSVVMPVCNEEESMPSAAGLLIQSEDKLNAQFEIIAVDDGSHDASFAVLKAAANG